MSPNAQPAFTVLAIALMTMLNTTSGTNVTASNSTSCETARLMCAYRTGCGAALQQYVTSCASDLRGDAESCPETCLLALIALTSTDEGKQLMTCTCDKTDVMCMRSKQRVEVCRASVVTAMNKTRVSCRIATTICNADSPCLTALWFYNKFCRSMFHGKKCTYRCRNSINILSRQEKAAKLNTCICDGAEDYDCKGIHRNMNYLCFNKIHHDYHEVKNTVHDTRTGEISRTRSGILSTGTRTIQQLSTILGLLLILYISQD